MPLRSCWLRAPGLARSEPVDLTGLVCDAAGRYAGARVPVTVADGEARWVAGDPQALRTVLCYGPVGVSDEAFAVLFRHDVDVSWLTPATRKKRESAFASRSITGLTAASKPPSGRGPACGHVSAL